MRGSGSETKSPRVRVWPARLMKAYRKQRQEFYRHCRLCHVTPSNAVCVGVCVLPMLELANEHVQLATTHYTNYINHWHVHPRHMNFWHTQLLPLLSNVQPAMALQNRVVWSNVKCLSSLNPATTGLGRRVVGMVVLLLLLMSGDIQTNPGPVGECVAS